MPNLGKWLVAAISVSGIALALAGWVAGAAPTEQGRVADQTLSFRNDIVPALTRAGCNLGACHGAQTGKGELLFSCGARIRRGITPRW
jgi:hypothetical protein